MRKLISILLSVLVMFGCVCTVSASGDFAELLSLGIIENTAFSDAYITKAEFAYSVAKMMNSGNIPAKATSFSDVTAENPYSGYIDFLAMRGVVDNTQGIAFSPENYVSIDMANKMIVSALGYGKFAELQGGYPVGYSSVSVSLGIVKNLKFKNTDSLTKEEAYTMLEKALKCETASVGNQINEGWDTSLDGEETLLSGIFGISVYNGIVDKARIGDSVIEFTAESNEYSANPEKVTAGQKLNYVVSGSVDIAKFEHVPVELWVKEDKVILIKEKKDVSVKYLTVYSANGKTSENMLLSSSALKEICFYNDEEDYDFADDGVIYYNGKVETNSVPFIGKLCKVVFEKGEVIALESWDYEEGGIIAEITDEALFYNLPNGKTASFKDIYDFENIRVIINGRGAEFTELRKNSVFDFWKNGDDIVLCVNEETVSDEFISYTPSSLEIGNGTYLADDVYYSEDGVKFTKNIGSEKLLGCFVKAYFAPNGKVRYVMLSGNESKFSEFYALIRGTKRDEMDDDEAEIMLYKMEDGAQKTIMRASKKTEYVNTSLDALEVLKRENITANIFLVTADENGSIRKVEKAGRLFGFVDDYPTPASFVNGLYSFSAGGKTLYFDGIPTTIVYEINDEIKISQVDFKATLSGRAVGDKATMSFYAKEDGLSPELILLTGDLSTIGKVAARQYGIYLDKTEVIDDSGNKMFELTILLKDGKAKFVVSEETAAKFQEKSFVIFYKDLLFSGENITLYAGPYNLEKSPSSWDTTEDKTGFKRGKVVRVNDKMLVADVFDNMDKFVSTEAYPVHPSQSVFFEYDASKANNQFTVIGTNEIESGDTIFFYYISDGLRVGIVVR